MESQSPKAWAAHKNLDFQRSWPRSYIQMRSRALVTAVNQLLDELDAPLLSEKGLDMRGPTADETLQVVGGSIALVLFRIDRYVLSRCLALTSQQNPATTKAKGGEGRRAECDRISMDIAFRFPFSPSHYIPVQLFYDSQACAFYRSIASHIPRVALLNRPLRQVAERCWPDLAHSPQTFRLSNRVHENGVDVLGLALEIEILSDVCLARDFFRQARPPVIGRSKSIPGIVRGSSLHRAQSCGGQAAAEDPRSGPANGLFYLHLIQLRNKRKKKKESVVGQRQSQSGPRVNV